MFARCAGNGCRRCIGMRSSPGERRQYSLVDVFKASKPVQMRSCNFCRADKPLLEDDAQDEGVFDYAQEE